MARATALLPATLHDHREKIVKTLNSDHCAQKNVFSPSPQPHPGHTGGGDEGELPPSPAERNEGIQGEGGWGVRVLNGIPGIGFQSDFLEFGVEH